VEQLELLSLVAPEFASVPEFAPLPVLEAQP